MSEKVPEIYAAICGVMEDIGAVGKDSTNKTQGFKYRGIDSVMNALNPAMRKHKVFCTPELLEQTREERNSTKGSTLIYSVCRMRYRFYTVDGSYVDAVTVGEGMDSGDKASNKAMAVAFKYACFQTFCIPTEDLMDEPDKESPEVQGNQNNRDDPIDAERQALMNKLSSELVRTGYSGKSVAKTYKVENMSDLTNLQIKDCIAKIKKLPDKAVEE